MLTYMLGNYSSQDSASPLHSKALAKRLRMLTQADALGKPTEETRSNGCCSCGVIITNVLSRAKEQHAST